MSVTRRLVHTTTRSPKHYARTALASFHNITRPSSTTPVSPENSPTGPRSWLQRSSNVRVSTLFNVLLALGAGATALGLYDVYTSFTQWPIEVRKDLRAGVSAKNQGDNALSERYLERAFQTAMSLPPLALGNEPYLKLSGIAAVLAEVSPERRAKEVLRGIWEWGGSESASASDSSVHALTAAERLRRVAVACKLAELCAEDDVEEERWLTWAVEEVLRLAGVVPGTNDGSNGDGAKSVVLAELGLPSWIRRVDLGAPMAALGAVYARKGNVEYAMPLYLQAVSLLLPPNVNVADVRVEDRCQAAQLMNNLSELIMRRPPSPEIRHQAEAWAKHAHGLIERVQEAPLRNGWFGAVQEQDREVCDQVSGVVLFNLGMLREMDGDRARARAFYEQSQKQCEKVGMKEGVLETKQALRRLHRAGRERSV